MAVTRSRTGRTKKIDTKVTEIETETERASKQTRKIRTNWAVMEIARCIFLEETFLKQDREREKHPHIKIGKKTQTSEVTKSGEKEWISMNATEKAPYVTQAEKRLAEFVEAQKQKSGTTKKVATKNAVKHKVAKGASKKITAESESKGAQRNLMESALNIFMSEYFKKNPDLRKDMQLPDFIHAGEEIWRSMSKEDKAPYIDKAKEKEAHEAERYRKLRSGEMEAEIEEMYRKLWNGEIDAESFRKRKEEWRLNL